MGPSKDVYQSSATLTWEYATSHGDIPGAVIGYTLPLYSVGSLFRDETNRFNPALVRSYGMGSIKVDVLSSINIGTCQATMQTFKYGV